MNILKKALIKAGGGYTLEGRPKGAKNKAYPKRDVIIRWREQNPSGTQAECKAETGISTVTICKYWHDVQNVRSEHTSTPTVDTIRGKSFGDLRNNRQWIKDDWILFAMGMAEAQDKRAEEDRQAGGSVSEWRKKAEDAEKTAEYERQYSKKIGVENIELQNEIARLKRKIQQAGKKRKESTGRPPKFDAEQLKQLAAKGKTTAEIAETLKISQRTAQRAINKYVALNQKQQK